MAKLNELLPIETAKGFSLAQSDGSNLFFPKWQFPTEADVVKCISGDINIPPEPTFYGGKNEDIPFYTIRKISKPIAYDPSGTKVTRIDTTSIKSALQLT